MSKNAKLILSIMSRFALHSVPRSGSSWVGAVLNKHPEIDALLTYTNPKGGWLQYQTKGFENMCVYQSK